MERRTAQRDAVQEALRLLDHPTADQVFAEVRKDAPRISLATVYRNLGQLVGAGLVAVREIGGQKRYDMNVTPHVHVHDTTTDRLVDVPLTPKLQAALAELASEWLDAHEDSIIELRGTMRKAPENNHD